MHNLIVKMEVMLDCIVSDVECRQGAYEDLNDYIFDTLYFYLFTDITVGARNCNMLLSRIFVLFCDLL